MYKSEQTFYVKTNQSDTELTTHLYLGKLVGRGIQDWDEEQGDFWSVNTQADMFGSFLAQIEADQLPLYPANQTQLQWTRADFGLESIAPADNGECSLRFLKYFKHS